MLDSMAHDHSVDRHVACVATVGVAIAARLRLQYWMCCQDILGRRDELLHRTQCKAGLECFGTSPVCDGGLWR